MPLTLASAGENNRSIASPANVCPTGDRRLPGLVSTSGHCHLRDSIDTTFASCLQVEQSHDAETFGKLRAFSFRGTKEHAGRRRTYTECSILGRGRRSERSPRTAESALAQFTVFLSLCFASSGE